MTSNQPFLPKHPAPTHCIPTFPQSSCPTHWLCAHCTVVRAYRTIQHTTYVLFTPGTPLWGHTRRRGMGRETRMRTRPSGSIRISGTCRLRIKSGRTTLSSTSRRRTRRHRRPHTVVLEGCRLGVRICHQRRPFPRLPPATEGGASVVHPGRGARTDASYTQLPATQGDTGGHRCWQGAPPVPVHRPHHLDGKGRSG